MRPVRTRTLTPCTPEFPPGDVGRMPPETMDEHRKVVSMSPPRGAPRSAPDSANLSDPPQSDAAGVESTLPGPQGPMPQPGYGTIASPDIQTVAILGDDAAAAAHRPETDAMLGDLPEQEMHRLYRAMVLTRAFDARMLMMQRQGQMGTFAPNEGQEATQIGQVCHLSNRDWFVPSYRSFGAQIMRGWEMERLMLLWDGYFEGFAPPPGLRDLPFSIVIGSHLLPATGLAMGMQYRGEDSVAVTNFGDGAMSQGAVGEALNFAAVNKAPIVFCVENNGWAISMPVEKQCIHPVLAQRGVGFGVPSVRVDGNDILAMWVAMRDAIARARRGDGPTLIEAITYRLGVHTTADDPKVYRDENEVEVWRARCPIKRFEAFLIARGLLDTGDPERIREECDQEVLDARDRFREQKKVKPEEVFDFIFEDLPPELAEQRRSYMEKLRRKGVQ